MPSKLHGRQNEIADSEGGTGNRRSSMDDKSLKGRNLLEGKINTVVPLAGTRGEKGGSDGDDSTTEEREIECVCVCVCGWMCVCACMYVCISSLRQIMFVRQTCCPICIARIFIGYQSKMNRVHCSCDGGVSALPSRVQQYLPVGWVTSQELVSWRGGKPLLF